MASDTIEQLDYYADILGRLGLEAPYTPGMTERQELVAMRRTLIQHNRFMAHEAGQIWHSQQGGRSVDASVGELWNRGAWGGDAPGSGPDADELRRAAQERENRKKAIEEARAWAEQYFSGAALNEIMGIINNAVTEGLPHTAVVREIRESDAYAVRFPAQKIRKNAGLPFINEADYISLERNYRQALASYNLPPTFYDQPDDFAKWIGGDVSAAEVQARAQLAFDYANEADPEVRNQLRAYGWTDGDITAYLLDPKRGESAAKERERYVAAGIGAAAVAATGKRFADTDLAKFGYQQNLSGTAGRLADAGYGAREVRERLGARRGLLGALHGEDELTLDTLAQGEFGLDASSQALVRRRQRQRGARGGGRTGGAVTQSGVLSAQRAR